MVEVARSDIEFGVTFMLFFPSGVILIYKFSYVVCGVNRSKWNPSTMNESTNNMFGSKNHLMQDELILYGFILARI
jgi:hypothetical protein